MKRLKNVRRGIYFALPAAFITSVLVVLFRYILLKENINPLNLTTWVSIFTIIPWLFVFQKHKSDFLKLSYQNIVLLIIIGIAGAMGVSYLQILALSNTTAINYAFIYRTITLFTVIFAWVFFKEKITRIKGIVVLFILFGTFLITTDGHGLVLTRGDIYALLVAASAAFISNILVKHMISKMHPDLSGSVISLAGAASLVVLAFTTNVFSIPSSISLVASGGLLYFLMLMLRNRAFKYSTASFISLIFGISPLFVVILAYFFLGETLEPVQIAGGLLIILATFFTEKFKM